MCSVLILRDVFNLFLRTCSIYLRDVFNLFLRDVFNLDCKRYVQPNHAQLQLAEDCDVLSLGVDSVQSDILQPSMTNLCNS